MSDVGASPSQTSLCFFRFFHRPADGSEVMYDPVSVMNADILNYCQKESWCKLGFYLLSFFYYLYRSVSIRFLFTSLVPVAVMPFRNVVVSCMKVAHSLILACFPLKYGVRLGELLTERRSGGTYGGNHEKDTEEREETLFPLSSPCILPITGLGFQLSDLGLNQEDRSE